MTIAILVLVQVLLQEPTSFADHRRFLMMAQEFGVYADSWQSWCNVTGADCRGATCTARGESTVTSVQELDHKRYLELYGPGVPRGWNSQGIDKWGNPRSISITRWSDGSLSLLVRSTGPDGEFDSASSMPTPLRRDSFGGDVAFADGCLFYDDNAYSLWEDCGCDIKP